MSTPTMRIVGAGIVAVLATIVGFLFVFTDIWVFGNSFEAALTGSYGWVIVPNLIAAVIITPILAAAWEPLKEAIGR